MERKVNKETVWRYERKFIVPKIISYNISNLIKSTPLCFSEIYAKRVVNNIYLDTPNYQFFKENINGLSERKKVRIRWYGETFGDINPNLEIKYKSGNVGTKKTLQISPFNFPDRSLSINPFSLSDSIRNLPLSYHWIKSLRVSLLNSYERSYYLSFDKMFRITVDKNLLYFPTSNSIKNDFNYYLKEDSTILELKYLKQSDLDADLITNYFPFRMTRNSKYVNGIRLIHSLHSRKQRY